MLIGFRSQPRRPRPPYYRLSRVHQRFREVRPGQSWVIGWLGRDGRLRLAGRPAIPRGGGCGPRSGFGCADGRAGVPAANPEAPPGRSTPWHRAAAAAGSRPRHPPVAAGVSHSGTGFHRRVAGSGRCLQGRGWSADQRPDVTRAAGVGPRLCGSPAVGEGTRARAAVLPMRTSCGRGGGRRTRLPSAVAFRPLSRPQAQADPCLGPAERRPAGFARERPPYPDAWLG